MFGINILLNTKKWTPIYIIKLWSSFDKSYAAVFYFDDAGFIKTADGFFESLFAHVKLAFDLGGSGFISHRQETVVDQNPIPRFPCS